MNRHRRGTCTNNRTILRQRIETRVLAGLKDRLVSSDSVAEAMQAFVEEVNRLNHARPGQAFADRKALKKVERDIQEILDAIQDGMRQRSMIARLNELECRQAEIMERLERVSADIPEVHPNFMAHYISNVERFTDALDDPDGGREATQAVRSLIGKIILNPGEKRGEVHISLRGELMGILDLAHANENKRGTSFMTAAVAGPRNH